MKIGLVAHGFPPASLGGTEVYTRNLARALSRHHDVSVFYRDDDDRSGPRRGLDRKEGFEVWNVARAFDEKEASPLALFLDTFYNREIEQSFVRFLDDVQPDLVHFQHLMRLSFRLIGQARARDMPSVLTLHDYWFICSNSQLVWPDAQICKGKAWGMNCARCATARLAKHWMVAARPLIALAIRLRDTLTRRAALRADQLIAPSRFLMHRYIAEGFPPGRFAFLENGLDIDRIHDVSRAPSSDDRLRVTYVGSLAWQKGVHVLVDAFRDLPSHRAILRIYGNPDTFPEYSADLRRRANPSNTVFEGRIPNEEVGRALSESDILAVPSLWYENSPVVIQEARAAGVPVMASAHGALTEKVCDGVDGLLIPPGEVTAWQAALQRLIDSTHLRARLAGNVPAPMTLDQHLDQLLPLYSELVDDSRGAC